MYSIDRREELLLFIVLSAAFFKLCLLLLRPEKGYLVLKSLSKIIPNYAVALIKDIPPPPNLAILI